MAEEETKASRPESTQEELDTIRRLEEPIEEPLEDESYPKVTTQSSVVQEIIDRHRDADREAGTSYKEGDRTLPPKPVTERLSEEEIEQMEGGSKGLGYGFE